MGLAAALSETPEPKRNLLCKVAKLRETLDGDDLAAFEQALTQVAGQSRAARMGRMSGFNASWLANVLTENGYPVTDGVIQRHLRQECSCGTV
jgi:hypothetical protein